MIFVIVEVTQEDTTGSHSFLEEQKFFRNAKFMRERRSQWAGVVHEGVTPLFDV